MAVGPLFNFCLWLRPASDPGEHFSCIISSLASRHDSSPCFSPHVTLLNAAAQSEEDAEDALLWLSDVAGAAEGALSLEIGAATVRCRVCSHPLQASSLLPVRTNLDGPFTTPQLTSGHSSGMQPHLLAPTTSLRKRSVRLGSVASKSARGAKPHIPAHRSARRVTSACSTRSEAVQPRPQPSTPLPLLLSRPGDACPCPYVTAHDVGATRGPRRGAGWAGQAVRRGGAAYTKVALAHSRQAQQVSPPPPLAV